MPTFDEISKQYADTLKTAKTSALAKSEGGTKIAAATKSEFREVVLGVVEHIDRWRVDKKPLTSDEQAEILRGVDRLLRVRLGTMEMLKKGSVEISLKFDQQVDRLFEQMEFI